MKRKFYLTFLIIFLIFIFYAFVVKGMRYYEVPSSSMEPALYPKDRIIVLKKKEIRRGDIIVFKDPTDPSAFMVKRVVAREGDEVAIKDGYLYLNGARQIEPYIKERITYTFPPKVIPEGHLFVLGDNRNQSKDSTIWGFLPQENVIGKCVYIYWPLRRRGPPK